VGPTITYVTELLVGLACLGLALVAWQRQAILVRVVAFVLAMAGAVAIVHATIRLVR
jgi:hypothetical protein